MTTWVVSDTHFGHARIIELASRPFRNVDEMDAELISRWNTTVERKDVVYHLGDFALCDLDRAQRIAKLLKGRRILIRGNHDRLSSKSLIEDLGFESVVPSLSVTVRGYSVFMRHRPPGKSVDRLDLHLHGHVHGRDSGRPANVVDVSVEATEYRPISLEKIVLRHVRKLCTTM